MKLQKPERHRTVTGRFTTLGEFMYNNRHLIDEGYTPEDIYNISPFGDYKYMGTGCVINELKTNEVFNDKSDIYLKIVKDMYLKKLGESIDNPVKLPVTPISEKLNTLTPRARFQSPYRENTLTK
jgi:hypothetical protein